MSKSKEMIAMILAGGQGSRLGALTQDIAKPAVPFGSKYRIIDFPLSNCTNSGIDTVGVLTQYSPLELNTYIGNGQPWDLDRNNGGVFILPPYVNLDGGEWYKGTANAIYQNLAFADGFDPEYILILSGDHIYKMDYSKMLDDHKKSGAIATIAVRPVPIEEASRFGIMTTDKENIITEFAEKPQKPKSNLASMGVYIFNYQTLKKYLMIDENNPKSSNDFGKNIIPSMLSARERIFAYNFSEYWKDVGTIGSLWEANMDLIDDDCDFNLDDDNWKIYSRKPAKAPQYIATTGTVRNSYLTEGAVVYGKVINSVLFSGAIIEEGAIIENSIIMPNAKVEKNCHINMSILGADCRIGENCTIGKTDNTEASSDDITLIGPNVVIDDDTVIEKSCMISSGIDAENLAVCTSA